jgi:hypothetical protein
MVFREKVVIIMRFILFFCVVFMAVILTANSVYIGTLMASKNARSISVVNGDILPLVIESQEIISQESVSLFAKKALVLMFNYRPGQAVQHIDSTEVKALFAKDEYYQLFREQFLAWSSYEFNVNNISIKDTIVVQGDLLISPPASLSGARVWKYSSTLPIVDRGVGGTGVSALKVHLSLVYYGLDGGMGIYAVKITL